MGIADKRAAKVLVTRIIKKVIPSIYRRSLIPSISIYLGQFKFTKRTIANIALMAQKANKACFFHESCQHFQQTNMPMRP
jgi:hypothetical protein